MLGKRYQYDGKPNFGLNETQAGKKAQFESKFNSGLYQVESPACAVCDGSMLEPVAEKDAYGLSTAVKICRACGLIQTNPRLTAASYQSFYNEEYQSLIQGSEDINEKQFSSQRLRGREILRYLQKANVMPRANSDPLVLEVGCNSGGILQYFREQGWRAKGIDLSEKAITYGQQHHRLDLTVGRLKDLRTEKFDLIIYSHSLEHILCPNEELMHVKARLKDTGILYVQVPGLKSLRKSYGMDFLTFIQCAHVYHFSLRTLRNLVTKNGYEFIAGDETINAVFRPAPNHRSKPDFISDYSDSLQYLRRAETLRRFTPSRANLISMLKAIGIYRVLKGIRPK